QFIQFFDHHHRFIDARAKFGHIPLIEFVSLGILPISSCFRPAQRQLSADGRQPTLSPADSHGFTSAPEAPSCSVAPAGTCAGLGARTCTSAYACNVLILSVRNAVARTISVERNP